MGYDLRLHIGDAPFFDGAHDNGSKRSPAYLMQIAEVELCVPCNKFYNAIHKEMKKGKYAYIYPDGNTKTIEDAYSERLRFVPAKVVLEHLKDANKTENYRRYDMAIALLKVVIEKFTAPVVVPFGH